MKKSQMTLLPTPLVSSMDKSMETYDDSLCQIALDHHYYTKFENFLNEIVSAHVTHAL